MADTTLKLILLGEDRSASKALGAVGIGAAVAAGALAKFGSDAVKAYQEAEAQQAKLEDAFTRFPKLADTNIDRLNDLNMAIQRKVGADADDLAGAQATLAQYDLTGKQLERITPLLVDYATKTGKDMPTAAGLLGKALMGNARAMKDLGIDFKATGDRAADFDTIVGHLDEKVGGYADSIPEAEKKQKILAASFEDLQEDIGEKLLPVLVSLVDTGQQVVDWASENEAVLIPLGAAAGVAATGIAGLVGVSKGMQVYKGVKQTVTDLGAAFERMGTKAKVASVSLGAVGLAVTVGAALWAAYAGEQEKAKQRVEDYTAALQSNTDALTDNIRAVATKSLSDRGALADADALGISLDLVTDAATGNTEALAELERQTWAIVKAETGLGSESANRIDAANKLRRAAQDEAGALAEARVEADRMARAQGESTTATKENTSATQDNADAQKELRDALLETYLAQLNLRGDTRALEAAYDNATEAAKENGKTLNDNTDKGRKNLEALDGIARAALSVKRGMEDQGAATEDVNAEMDRARTKFTKAAEKMGMAKDEAEALADKLGLIKSKDVDLNLRVHWRGALSKQISVDGTGAGKITLRASGGVPREGEWSIVGEQGPELVRFPMPGARVYSNDQSKSLAAAAGRRGGDINIQITGAIDPHATARQVRSVLLQLKRDLGGISLGFE